MINEYWSTNLKMNVLNYINHEITFPLSASLASSLHLSVASIQAHLLFMRLDWATTPGLPCTSYSSTVTTSAAYHRLAHRWQGVACGLASLLRPTVGQAGLEANTGRVVGEGVHRRRGCRARRTRDCLVLVQGEATLARLGERAERR